jgi:hypothetical protein
LPEIIEPRWWTGEPALAPESFTIDCSVFDMAYADLSTRGELGVLIGEPFERVGDRDGKW